jgi:hypothetical protein
MAIVLQSRRGQLRDVGGVETQEDFDRGNMRLLSFWFEEVECPLCWDTAFNGESRELSKVMTAVRWMTPTQKRETK